MPSHRPAVGIARALCLALFLPVLPATAQQSVPEALARSLEMPAHAALMRLMARPGTERVPFTTDGCSGGLSDTWEVVADRFPDFAAAHEDVPPWERCCVVHDRAYHAAGNATDAGQSFDARLAADRALRDCVGDTAAARIPALAALYDATPGQVAAAYGSIAQAMFLAVRFGGAPCSGLPWRWGYGYAGCTVLTGAFD